MTIFGVGHFERKQKVTEFEREWEKERERRGEGEREAHEGGNTRRIRAVRVGKCKSGVQFLNFLSKEEKNEPAFFYSANLLF